MKLIYTLLILTLLSCGGHPDQPIEVSTDEYIVTDFNPPKHVSVTLTRVSDGRQFEIRFGKHCSNWRNNVIIGEHLMFNRYTYTDGESDRIEFNDEEFKNCFCN